MDNALYSSMIRSGNTTYFVDVKEAKTGKKYLVITENRITKEFEKTRSTIKVFSDSITQVVQAITKAAKAAQ